MWKYGNLNPRSITVATKNRVIKDILYISGLKSLPVFSQHFTDPMKTVDKERSTRSSWEPSAQTVVCEQWLRSWSILVISSCPANCWASSISLRSCRTSDEVDASIADSCSTSFALFAMKESSSKCPIITNYLYTLQIVQCQRPIYKTNEVCKHTILSKIINISIWLLV